jgi:hypothetical protein
MLHFTFVIGNLRRYREVAASMRRAAVRQKLFAAAAMSPPAHNRSAGYGVHD